MTPPVKPETPTTELRPTQVVERVVEAIEAKQGVSTPAERSHSRMIEDMLAFAGILQALFSGTLEALTRAGFKFGDCPTDHSFPWVTVIIFLGCVLPKTVGRASAGAVWKAIADKLGSK
jgi:hypothetical protein